MHLVSVASCYYVCVCVLPVRKTIGHEQLPMVFLSVPSLRWPVGELDICWPYICSLSEIMIELFRARLLEEES